MAERSPLGRPLLVELDPATLAAYRDAVAPWLATVATLQGAYRRLLRRTIPRIADPLVRDWLDGVERSAREHERAVDELHLAFDVPRPRRPLLPGVAASLLGAAKELAGQLEGRSAGASSAAWRNLRQLQLANLDAMSAFAVAQQLGLAHGRPQVVDVTFPVVAKKSEQQLLLQELFLEFATDAVLQKPPPRAP